MLLHLCIYLENRREIYIYNTSSEELSVKDNQLIEHFCTWDLSFLLVVCTCIEPTTSPQARGEEIPNHIHFEVAVC